MDAVTAMPAVAPPHHMRRCRSDRNEDAREVRLQQIVPAVQIDLRKPTRRAQRAASRGEACISEDYIEPPFPFGNAVDGTDQQIRVCHLNNLADDVIRL